MEVIRTSPGGFLIRLSVAVCSTALAVMATGCNDYAEHAGVTTTVQEAVDPFHGEEIVDAALPVLYETVPVADTYRESVFQVRVRKDSIQRFKCSQCHATGVQLDNDATGVAHGDIEKMHGKKDDPLACFTCHNENERDFLLSEKGEKIDPDHSYLLCGRCHFREANDWIGGAHGKRISYWAGPRVVQNCTYCHDPHAPKIASQWPATYSPPLEE